MSHVHLKSHRSLFAAALVVALVLPLAAAQADSEARASNLSLMKSLTRETVGDVLDQIGPEIARRGFRLRAYAASEEYQFLTNVITSVLNERGIPAYLPQGGDGASVPADALVFQYQTISYGVTYERVYRSHLIGGKRVQRAVDTRISATVIDPASGEVSWVGESGKAHEDEFPYGELASVEEGSFAFVHPALPGGGWGRYAEPVLVSGIVVGLIYLFFSNQSGN